MKRTTYLAAGAILATAVFAPGARAAYVVNFVEMGANVVEVGGGTLDLTNLTAGAGAATNSPSVFPAGAFFDSGDTSADVKEYFSISGASNFGSGASVKFASSSSGDGVAIGTRLLFVPEFYISNSPLSETSTYLDATFASLGMTPGQYVYTWGAGDHANSFTINIGANPVPEPSTWAMMVLGFAGLGYAASRRKRAPREASA